MRNRLPSLQLVHKIPCTFFGMEADVYLRQQLKQLIKPGGDDVTVFNGNEQKLRKRANAGDSDAEIELRSGVELLMRMLKHGMPKTSKSQRLILDAIRAKVWIETGNPFVCLSTHT